jgi:predicted transposase YbfD/YdcC
MQGKNRVDIVVANLLANKMHWDIFDDVKAEETNRKWHDGNLLRDVWCFDSGLSGPVKLETVQ